MDTGVVASSILSVNHVARFAAVAVAVAGAALLAPDAQAQTLAMAIAPNNGSIVSDAVPGQDGRVSANEAAEIPAALRRQVVDYATSEAPGTIVVDTPHTYLYYILGGGQAVRYGIGVGRDGFTWSGVKAIERKSEWPDWIPPVEMLERQPYLPRFMAGGPGNPLGARAMYLSGTIYRIHGTNKPSSIGQHVSSGCIRMLNADVIDLYSRTRVGTKVVVLPMTHPHLVQASPFAASLR